MHLEAADELACKDYDNSIDDKQKQAEGQDGDGQGNDDQQGLYKEVQDRQHERYDERGAEAVDGHAGRDDIRGEYNGDGGDERLGEEILHEVGNYD